MIVKGQKVNSRYEILKTIGEGGMANVYLARDIILDRQVAVKVLRGDLSNDEKFVRRFQREALSASSLSHPNIVEIYDVGEDDGDYYIVMEYVDGKDLKQLLKKRERLTSAEVVDIMLQITSAMKEAHESLIIHRDLKPQNILIKDDGMVKITDFGIAMALNATQLTQTNSAMGSVHYFPPEQANGKGSSLKSDVYSLGIMMYELLSGTLPFRGDNAVEIALKHLKEPMPLIRTEFPDLPQSLENIIIKATAKNPKNRYANAGEMYEDLKTSLNRERLNEPPISFKYDEGVDEDTIVVNKKSDVDDSLVKEIRDDKKKPKNKKLLVAGIVFASLVVLTLFAILILPMVSKVPEVAIPDVSGLTEEVATKKLEKVGLTVAPKVIEEESDEVDKGLVIETNPKIGKTVKEGTEVTLTVSKGAEEVVVEDYIGKNYIEIKTKLEMKGIVVEVSKKDASVINDDNQLIVDQSVSQGEKLKKGDKITLYIPNVVKEYCPDMVNEGWTESKAKSWATKLGVILTVRYEETDLYTPGNVMKQSKESGDEVVKGDTLVITVAKKPTVSSQDQSKNKITANSTSNTEKTKETKETKEE